MPKRYVTAHVRMGCDKRDYGKSGWRKWGRGMCKWDSGSANGPSGNGGNGNGVTGMRADRKCTGCTSSGRQASAVRFAETWRTAPCPVGPQRTRAADNMQPYATNHPADNTANRPRKAAVSTCSLRPPTADGKSRATDDRQHAPVRHARPNTPHSTPAHGARRNPPSTHRVFDVGRVDRRPRDARHPRLSEPHFVSVPRGSERPQSTDSREPCWVPTPPRLP